MAKAGSGARAAALAAMTAVTEEGQLLSDALPSAAAALDPGERARAGRIAAGALRWSGRADRLLGPYLRSRPEDRVLNLLRLAIFEIFADGIPSHAAVDGAVGLAPRRAAGLVNAVLRGILRAEPDWSALPLPPMPKWLRKPLVAAWGKDAVATMEAVHAADPPLDLTLRDPGTAAVWAERLGATLLPTGSLRLEGPAQVSALAGYGEGAWWVQDAGAALAARLLAPTPGESVLDLCAAPGGKTMQLASAGARVTAVEISAARIGRLKENLARTGLSAECAVADLNDWQPGAPADAILLDAPCSATGTLRRHPDLVHARDGSGVAALVGLQARLLDRALGWLRPGGRLVYATCSLLPDEGEAQLAGALARHEGLVATLPEAGWIDPRWRSDGGGLRLRPDHWAETGGIDGFFIFRVELPS